MKTDMHKKFALDKKNLTQYSIKKSNFIKQMFNVERMTLVIMCWVELVTFELNLVNYFNFLFNETKTHHTTPNLIICLKGIKQN